MRWSKFEHDVCHWSRVICSFIRVVVSSLILSVFSSKNFVLNFSILCGGIGFRILGGILFCGGVGRAINIFGGICSVTGEWSEFRLWSLFVVDVYRE